MKRTLSSGHGSDANSEEVSGQKLEQEKRTTKPERERERAPPKRFRLQLKDRDTKRDNRAIVN